jgi:hypothetical protein
MGICCQILLASVAAHVECSGSHAATSESKRQEREIHRAAEREEGLVDVGASLLTGAEAAELV